MFIFVLPLIEKKQVFTSTGQPWLYSLMNNFKMWSTEPIGPSTLTASFYPLKSEKLVLGRRMKTPGVLVVESPYLEDHPI